MTQNGSSYEADKKLVKELNDYIEKDPAAARGILSYYLRGTVLENSLPVVSENREYEALAHAIRSGTKGFFAMLSSNLITECFNNTPRT